MNNHDALSQSMNIASDMIQAGRDFGDQPSIAKGTRILLHYRDLAERVTHIAGTFAVQFSRATDRTSREFEHGHNIRDRHTNHILRYTRRITSRPT